VTTGTDGERIYAIGDIHGCTGLMDAMVARVRADVAARPHRAPRMVFLGDYMDRGPDSRGVLERLIALRDGPIPASFLLGNHDAMTLAFLASPEDQDRPQHWLDSGMGGTATVLSYGVEDPLVRSDLRRTHAEFVAAFPAAHRAFLEGCALSLRIGAYVFVHAGIRPGVALDEQSPEDLIWIREPFLSSRADHGVKVVHGHTVVRFVEHHPNRIAVDTGAVVTGRLSCVVLEDAAVGLLTSVGLRPLPEGAGLGLDRVVRRVRGQVARLAQGRGRTG
jgi:serine/threonine protein phosphatase 1